MKMRDEVVAADEAAVRALVAATRMFHDDEVDVAAELVRERLTKGDESGYHFLMADAEDGSLSGYACFGPIPCTRSSWDLYWIAVDPGLQGQGLGRALLEASEGRVAALGGTRVYVDTSGRPDYEPTRAFYERCGYAVGAHLRDFYDVGDGKVIFEKVL
ncbi:MAG: GNAT family N-acetyltransferase [Alphaproteobacteria bacterium]|nr:GNAT family N-acetyltransferase [Alphaproteobacteria bacterium]